MKTNAIILCGGLSTRLGDITKTIPKILLDIKGRTVLDRQLEKLREIGINKVIMAAGHLSDVLKKEVGNSRDGTELIYAVEKERLGTGGAIRYAWSFFDDKQMPVVVLNGDVLTTGGLGPMIRALRPESEGIIFGARVDDASTYGTLIFDEEKRLKEFREKEGVVKPGYINGGVYLFTGKALGYFPDKTPLSVEYDVFPNMRDLDVYASDDPWIDIGLPERLDWARGNWPD